MHNTLARSLSLVLFLLISACKQSVPITSTHTPVLIGTITPAPALTLEFTKTSAPAVTQPPVLTPTTSLTRLDRPEFLAWPLPAHIGLARISQFPDTPWSWHSLGLNDGFACPPMFGYLLNLDSLAYWRDVNILEEQDKAQADPHQFEMVECYAGHAGTDIKAPAGTPVYAAADGKIVQWHLEGLNSMVVIKHCMGGVWDTNNQCVGGRQWYTSYIHLIPDPALLQENLTLAQGATLGTIYDQTINSHLHFEVGLDKRDQRNLRNPWGHDEPPWQGCLWQDQTLCTTPNPDSQRIFLLTTTSDLFVQIGEQNPVEWDMPPNLELIRSSEKRVIAVDTSGNLHLFEELGVDWAKVAENILDAQVTNNRLAILDQKKDFWVSEGSSQYNWVFQAANVFAFSVSEHRIGYLTEDGKLYVRDDDLSGEWAMVAEDVLTFQLVDNRIAYTDQQRTLYVNEGDLQAEFQRLAENVRAFQVTNVRMGVLDQSGKLLVQEGNLRANWVPLAENVLSFQLAGYRVLILNEYNSYILQTGNLFQGWNTLSINALDKAFLNGTMPTYLP